MNDRKMIEGIMTSTERDLLTFVMCWPEYLTDPYYREFGNAIRARYDQLEKTWPPFGEKKKAS